MSKIRVVLEIKKKCGFCARLERRLEDAMDITMVDAVLEVRKTVSKPTIEIWVGDKSLMRWENISSDDKPADWEIQEKILMAMEEQRLRMGSP